MRLHGYWRSTASWRVRIALAYKNVPFEYVPVNLVRHGGDQHRPEFRALNPMGHVPVLEIDEGGVTHRLAESMALLEFLEERYPNPPLLPSDPFVRARARQLALLVVSGIQPLQNTKIQRWIREEMSSDADAWTRHWVSSGLASLETLTQETAGTFSIGDAVSVADICLVPQLAFARRFAIDLTPFPTLLSVEAACASLPAFIAGHAKNQPDAEPGG